MSNTVIKNPLLLVGAGLFVGLVIGIAFNFSGGSNSSSIDANSGEREPLYWVAPMDANYRRDEPGRSPMGMDLVPVYEEDAAGQDEGSVTVSPRVVNNLGVRTQAAKIDKLHNEIRTVGYIQYDEDRLVHVHPRISGWIEKLYVKAAGDPVTKDQPLYEIYSPELVNAQEELLLALERNNNRLVQASKDRLLALQVDQTLIDEIQKSRKVTQTVVIYSPQDGIVDNLNVREGFYVKPDTTMMQIGALDEVWVHGEVFERQADLVKQAMPVTMTLDYLPGRDWAGEVDYVYPTLDPKTRTVRVRMRFKNPEMLFKPNMFAQLAIHSDSEREMLLIPKQALIRTAKMDRVVMALGEGKFKSVAVIVGHMDREHAEIVDGLSEGDLVVTSAQFLLDSESNISADLMRMEDSSTSMPNNSMQDMAMTDATSSEENNHDLVVVEADINDIMIDHRMINVTHKPIPEWSWPVMTMNFDVAEGIDLSELQVGAKVQMEVTGNPTEKFSVTRIQMLNVDESENSSSEQHQH